MQFYRNGIARMNTDQEWDKMMEQWKERSWKGLGKRTRKDFEGLIYPCPKLVRALAPLKPSTPAKQPGARPLDGESGTHECRLPGGLANGAAGEP